MDTLFAKDLTPGLPSVGEVVQIILKYSSSDTTSVIETTVLEVNLSIDTFCVRVFGPTAWTQVPTIVLFAPSFKEEFPWKATIRTGPASLLGLEAKVFLVPDGHEYRIDKTLEAETF